MIDVVADPGSKVIVSLVVGDLQLGRDGIASLLDRDPAIELLSPTCSVGELRDRLTVDDPDVVVLYLVPGVRAAAQLASVSQTVRESSSDTRLVIISPTGDGMARTLLQSGPDVVAFLVDGRVGETAVLVRVIQDAVAGVVSLDPSVVEVLAGRRGYPGLQELTRREFEVLSELSDGLSNPAIATRLGLSVKAIEANVSQIFRKLGLHPDPGRDRRLTAALIYLQERF